MSDKMYCLQCREWVEVDGKDDNGNEYHLVSAGMCQGRNLPCGPLREDEEAALVALLSKVDELTEANGDLAWKLYQLKNAEPLNEVCEHGCHIDDTYGFVVMMGCPEHD